MLLTSRILLLTLILPKRARKALQVSRPTRKTTLGVETAPAAFRPYIQDETFLSHQKNDLNTF